MSYKWRKSFVANKLRKQAVALLSITLLLNGHSLASGYLIGGFGSIREALMLKGIPCLYQGFKHIQIKNVRQPVRMYRYSIGKSQYIHVTRLYQPKTEDHKKILRVDFYRGTTSSLKSAEMASHVVNATSSLDIPATDIDYCWKTIGKPTSFYSKKLRYQGFNDSTVDCFYDGKVEGIRISLID